MQSSSLPTTAVSSVPSADVLLIAYTVSSTVCVVTSAPPFSLNNMQNEIIYHNKGCLFQMLQPAQQLISLWN